MENNTINSFCDNLSIVVFCNDAKKLEIKNFEEFKQTISKFTNSYLNFTYAPPCRYYDITMFVYSKCTILLFDNSDDKKTSNINKLEINGTRMFKIKTNDKKPKTTNKITKVSDNDNTLIIKIEHINTLNQTILKVFKIQYDNISFM
jgi:hypothetical protein